MKKRKLKSKVITKNELKERQRVKQAGQIFNDFLRRETMKKELTKKQKKLLKFYIYNWKEVPPTYQEMARFMGVGSKQSIVDMIKLIEKKLGSVVSIRRSTLRNQRGVSANLTAPTTRFEQQEFLGIDNYGESSCKSIL